LHLVGCLHHCTGDAWSHKHNLLAFTLRVFGLLIYFQVEGPRVVGCHWLRYSQIRSTYGSGPFNH